MRQSGQDGAVGAAEAAGACWAGLGWAGLGWAGIVAQQHTWSALSVILAACELLPSEMLTLSSIEPSSVSPSSHVRFSTALRASSRRRKKTARAARMQAPTRELAMVTMIMTGTGLWPPSPEESPDAVAPLGSSGAPGGTATSAGGGGGGGGGGGAGGGGEGGWLGGGEGGGGDGGGEGGGGDGGGDGGGSGGGDGGGGEGGGAGGGTGGGEGGARKTITLTWARKSNWAVCNRRPGAAGREPEAPSARQRHIPLGMYGTWMGMARLRLCSALGASVPP